jgi:hypothetical protein
MHFRHDVQGAPDDDPEADDVMNSRTVERSASIVAMPSRIRDV